MDPDDKPSGTQALDRSLDILFLLAEATDGMRLVDIAARTGLSSGTARRLINALLRRGVVQALPDQRRYVLGLKIFGMAARASEASGLHRIARPSVARVAARTGDCVFLMARSGFDAICVDRLDAGYSINTIIGGIGGVTPLGYGPGSLSMLSHLPEKERQAVLAHNTQRIAGLGGMVPDMGQMAEIRRLGHVYETKAVIPDIASLAIPIRTALGTPIGSLGVGAISSRLQPARVPEVLEALREEVRAIEAAIPTARSIPLLS